VLATFALGTAAGDMTATSLGWGYPASAIVFTCVIAVPAIAYWRTDISRVLIFWSAYVITRPLGASIADWLGKPHDKGGLGIGEGTVSLLGALAIVALVSYLTLTERDVVPEPAPQALE